MEFNLADLFECVADARARPRGGRVRRRARCTYASSTSARPGSRTRCAALGRRARRPRRPLPPQLGRARRGDARVLQAARGPDQRQLPLRRRRARVPLRRRRPRRARSTTPTPRRTSTRCRSHGVAARGRRRRFGRELRGARATSGSPARDFGPRSADDHYVLYTGGTTGLPEGRRVAAGGHLLRRRSAAGTRAARRSTAPEADRARRCSTTPRNGSRAFLAARRSAARRSSSSLALGPLDARERPVVGARHAARRRQGRALRRAARRHGRACSTSSSASASTRCNLVGDASARPLLDALERRPGPLGHCRRCGCSARAAASCRAT